MNHSAKSQLTKDSSAGDANHLNVQNSSIGPTHSATVATNCSIESSVDKPCCTNLAKSVYKKVLESAKKAIPHSLHADKSLQNFPRSSGDLGRLSVHTIDSEMEAPTEASFDYEDELDAKNSQRGTMSSSMDDPAADLKNLLQMSSAYPETDEEYFQDESGSPDDIDLDAFRRHVQASIENDQDRRLNEPKVISSYLKDSKRKKMLTAHDCRSNANRSQQDDQSAVKEDKQGIFRVRNKTPTVSESADLKPTVRDSIESSEMGDSSTIDLPTITISEDELADSSLNMSQSTLCGSDFDFVGETNSNWSSKEKQTEEDAETLRSAVNASERLKTRFKNVSGKVKDLFGAKEKEKPEVKVNEMIKELDQSIVYRKEDMKTKKNEKSKKKANKEDSAENSQIETKEKKEKKEVKKDTKVEESKKDRMIKKELFLKKESVQNAKGTDENRRESIVSADRVLDYEIVKYELIVAKREDKELEPRSDDEELDSVNLNEPTNEIKERIDMQDQVKRKEQESKAEKEEADRKKEELEKVRLEKKAKEEEEKSRKKAEAEELRLKRIKEEEDRKKAEQEEKRKKEEEIREKKAKDDELKRKLKEKEKELKEEEKRLKEEERKRKEEEKKLKELDERRRKEEMKEARLAEERRRKEEKEESDRLQREAELLAKEQRLRQVELELMQKATEMQVKLAEQAEQRLKAERERIERDLQKKQEAESKRLADQLAKLERERAKKDGRRSLFGSSAAVSSIGSLKELSKPSTSSAQTKLDVDSNQDRFAGQEHPRMLSSVGNTDDELLLQIESASVDGDCEGRSSTAARRKVLLSKRLRDTRSKLNKLRLKAVEKLRDLLPDENSEHNLFVSIKNKMKRSASLSSMSSARKQSASLNVLCANDQTDRVVNQTSFSSSPPPPRPPPPKRNRIAGKVNASEPNLKEVLAEQQDQQAWQAKRQTSAALAPPPRPPPPSASRLTVNETMEDVNLKDEDQGSRQTIAVRPKTPADQFYRELLDDWRRKHVTDSSDAKSMIGDTSGSKKRWMTHVNDAYSQSTPNVQRCVSSASTIASRPAMYDDYRYRLKRRALARKTSSASKAPTESAFSTVSSIENVVGLPPIAPPRRRLTTGSYLSGSKSSLHRQLNVDYFRPEVDRSQQAVDALFWKPFSWKCGRCRSLTELYVRKQQLPTAQQVRAFEQSSQFQLATEYCVPKRPPPPPRASSRYLNSSTADVEWSEEQNVLFTSPSPLLQSILLPPESYCSVSSGQSPALDSPPSLTLPPIPPPPVPPRMRFTCHEKQLQTSLEDVSDELSGSDEQLPQSLTYRSALSPSSRNNNSQLQQSHVYYDADVLTADYDTYGDVDSLDVSLLSCLSHLSQSEAMSNSLNATWTTTSGTEAAPPKPPVKRRKRRPLPDPTNHSNDSSTIIQIHNQYDLNDDTDKNIDGDDDDDDDEEEDDTDEIIGIAASLQREIKQLIERRKAQQEARLNNDDDDDDDD